MNVLLAMNSYKGSMTSKQLNEILQEEILRNNPNLSVTSIPVADGGEGTLEAIMSTQKGTLISTDSTSPVGAKITTQYWLSDNHVAFIEMAKSCGLPLVPMNMRDPMETSTFGLGEVILDAYRNGIRNFVVTLGGSATNDGGSGFLEALGYRFFDQKNQLLKGKGSSLSQIARIDNFSLKINVTECHFEVACDVDNPLYGPSGAAFIYGPQKGATPEMVLDLDRGLRDFAQVVSAFIGRDDSMISGSGAAGGVGFALRAFLNATMKRGVDILFDAIHFANLLAEADIVITGEGRMDEQTLFGKAPGEIARKAKEQNIPCYGICGSVVEKDLPILEKVFTKIISIHDKSLPIEEAMKSSVTAKHLKYSISSLLESI